MIDQNAFGGLYPPRDATQKQLYAAMKAFAESGGPGSPETLTLQTISMSGFHKASYVWLQGLQNTTGGFMGVVCGSDRPY